MLCVCLYVRGHKSSTHGKVTASPQLSIFLTFDFEAEPFMFVADCELQSDGDPGLQGILLQPFFIICINFEIIDLHWLIGFSGTQIIRLEQLLLSVHHLPSMNKYNLDLIVFL